MGFLASKTWILWNNPIFWQVLNLRFRYNVSPISLYSLKVLRFWQAKVGHGFLASRNMVLIKQPRFWRVFYLKFWYNVGAISLFSFKKKKKNQDFDKSYRQCVFGVKNLVLKKYPKISIGVNPGILIQCRPNIFALFEKPKILTSKVGHGFFGVTSMVLMKYPKILTGILLLDILIKCRPKIVVLFKNHKENRPWVFWRQKIWFLWNLQDFDRCFTWHLEKM